jgi:hypothetical protein
VLGQCRLEGFCDLARGSGPWRVNSSTSTQRRWAVRLPVLRLPDAGQAWVVRDLPGVRFWEDDGQDDHDADEVRGGPNRGLSLTVAGENFARIGASEPRRLPNVRPPRNHEHPQAHCDHCIEEQR